MICDEQPLLFVPAGDEMGIAFLPRAVADTMTAEKQGQRGRDECERKMGMLVDRMLSEDQDAYRTLDSCHKDGPTESAR